MVCVCVCEGDWQIGHGAAALLINLHVAVAHQKYLSPDGSAELDNELCRRGQRSHVLLPVGGQDPLGLVVAGQPVDPALDEDQAELGVLVLQHTRVRLKAQ